MVLESIPRAIEGVDELEILVIDDGSTDGTVRAARACGVAHIVRHTRNQGLARSFRDGVDYALAHGADVVVNTDGDNQYPQERIPDLLAPIVQGRADIVIADRQTKDIAHFSRFKKRMQSLGSGMVNLAAGTRLPDAASGFRAYSRRSLLRLNVVTGFSYCMETIVQAGNLRMRIESVKIRTNPKTRESRLFSNIFQHMYKSGKAIVRSFLMYKPHIPLGFLAVVTGIVGLVPFLRFLVFWFQGESGGHVQSLIFGTAMIVTSLLSAGLLVVADLQRTNRVLIEDTLERMKALQYGEASREGVMLGCGSREDAACDAACAHDDAASGGEGAAHGDEDGDEGGAHGDEDGDEGGAHGDEDGDEGGAHGDGRDAARRGETRPAPGGAVQLEPGGNARHAPDGPI
ncbi:glycosyl transferase [Peptidiphaga gingivicola]|uniref:Glycosyl transferase n=2 Tax=Peptidiphaga gingivicola TaxID=2741497 RepID=A0A179B6V1_9ACTO|nr:glycosyl transferase [Peptidiphaga gingivicola]